ncbi:MAG: peptidylprolyl isomerase [Sulfurimonas sp.]|nr:peptidylprolyl isomerase [Sulfurimonas sp.]
MKKILLAITLSISLFAGKNIMPENTVAVVNGMALSNEELQEEINILMPMSAYHASAKESSLNKTKKKAMKALIKSTLLYQYALSIGIKPDDTEMKEIYKKLMNELGSKKAIERELKRVGLSIKIIEKRYAKKSVLEQLYKKKLKITKTESELKEYYKKNMYKFKEPEKVKVSLIYVKNNPTDPKGKSKAKAKAEEALNKIKSGEDFGNIAAKYSDAMSRIKGGDMGFLHKGRLHENVEREAFNMKVGEVSKIIEKDVGFYIVKVTDKKKTNQLSFDKVKKSLEKDLIKKEEKKIKEKLLKKLESEAKIIQ